MAFRWFSLSGNQKVFEFRCACCGEIHRGSPSFGYEKPMLYFSLPEDQRAERIRLTSDTCVVDDDTFFIRGLIEIPIHDVEEPFSWGVWVSQSRESFDRYVETYDDDQSGNVSFGWLEVTMPGYSDGELGWATLACDVHWQAEGDRPHIVPHACDHPLYRDVTEGISWDRAIELARLTMHPEGD